MGSSVAVVDAAIPHETHCAQELLHPMPAFLKMTHAVQWSAHLHVLFGK
jgi:hypothetical protein